MPASRFLSCTLLAAGFLALVVAMRPATAQPGKDDLPKPPPNITGYKDNAGKDLNKAKGDFITFAKYQADIISHPKIYSVPQEFVPPKGPVVPTTDALITELGRSIITPAPGSNIGIDQADYIRELGIALDQELKIVIDRNATPVVRLNAMRMLAAACKSGAQVHWPTITGYISNPNTPGELKYYAFQAAGNLLAAYDLNDYSARKHAHKPKEASDLIAALQNAILKPGAIVPAPPAGVAMTPEQIDVLRFIRRAAIRALGQVRYSDRVANGAPDLYPAYTLAQVAESDPAIQPPPSETEVAEAVIGLCNMSPPSKTAEKEPYAYATADAILTGITTFATQRAAAPLDTSIAWRSYGARLSDALKAWRPLFELGYSPAKPLAVTPGAAPKIVDDVVNESETRVLKPMYEKNGTVDLNGLRAFRDNSLRGDKKFTLSPFVSNPKLIISKKN
jgi:hypothetical protein